MAAASFNVGGTLPPRPSSGSSTPSSTSMTGSLVLAGQDDKTLNKAIGSESQTYVVPVLEKGVKTALVKPVTKRTRFRVWYNDYRRLYTLVLVLNGIAIVLAGAGHFPYADEHVAAVALGNVLGSVFVRNELFFRGIFWFTARAFKWCPRWFRVRLTRFMQHLGGVHSGAATASFAWLIYAVVQLFRRHRMNHPMTLAFSVITAFVIALVLLTALPPVRRIHHNLYEYHHRYAGWSGLACVWVFVVLSVCQVAPENGGAWTWSGAGLIHAQQFWFAMFITITIFIPWTMVRKVPVEITVPTPGKVAIVKFQRGITRGLLGRVAHHPFGEWHGFGIISEGPPGGCHYMIVGAQGDWTQDLVDNPPKFLWTRELKFAGLPYLSALYRRGIAICTGSGVGAALSIPLQDENYFFIWIGSDLEKTFGPALFEMIHRRIKPERRILFDTRKEGCRPDTVQMLKDVYRDWRAEVVIITSNPKGNRELMQACKENEMPSFGPLWDS